MGHADRAAVPGREERGGKRDVLDVAAGQLHLARQDAEIHVRAQRRFAPRLVDQAIAELAAIDRAIKGVGLGEPWPAFLALGLKLADGSKG